MASMQKTILVGFVGNDPEARFTPEGTQVTNLSLAVEVGYGEKKETQWWRISFWGKPAETVHQYVTKGMQLYIEGEAKFSVWSPERGEPRVNLDLTARTFLMLGKKGESNAPGADLDGWTPATPSRATTETLPF